MEILHNYNYALFDAFRKRKEKEAEADLIKAQALAEIAGQPAEKTNPLLYVIPIAAVVVLGIVVIIKRKKS